MNSSPIIPYSAPSTPGGSAPSTGAKRGRKPRARGAGSVSSPRTGTQELGTASPQFSHVHWALPADATKTNSPAASATASPSIISSPLTAYTQTTQFSVTQSQFSASQPVAGPSTTTTTTSSISSSFPSLDLSSLISMPATSYVPAPAASMTLPQRIAAGDDEGDGDDEMLPAMADDDYSAQLSWQSQSKDNLKVLMENFSPAQYDRFEAYRRHALPKQGVRKVVSQLTGQNVSGPVAQIIAGFSKVFVGEIVEKARAVQARRRETGPLSPDHLREAYRMYQEETGHIGSARPLRGKKLFVR
ncbi:TAFII28-domain-containing protein [Mycena floridula]|nr:TAFII28-domain-containing protein [Mycena floridula]